MSSDPAGWELVNPMEPDEEGGWRPKASYSVIEATNWYAYVSNNPVRYVDPTGMYILSAKNDEACIVVEKGDTLSEIVETQNPSVTPTEIYGKVQEIASLNNLDNPDLIFPGRKLLAPESVVPDITDDLMEKMETNSKDFRRHSLFYFRDKVTGGGDWDYKSHDGTVYDTTPRQYYEYLFDGKIVRYDAPSNIHYGYVGKSAVWGSEKFLLEQAAKAHIADNPGKGLTGDDPVDAYYIQMGIQIYKNRNK